MTKMNAEVLLSNFFRRVAKNEIISLLSILGAALLESSVAMD